jgi:hypothetical protein
MLSHCLGLCAPFSVTRNPDVGRQLVATRRIVAGEILCQEEPLIVGPNQVTTETVYFKTFMDPRNRFLQGTDSPPAYVVAWRAGTTTLYSYSAPDPIECSKIPALVITSH